MSLSSPVLMLLLKKVLVPGGTDVPFRGDEDEIELVDGKHKLIDHDEASSSSAAGGDTVRLLSVSLIKIWFLLCLVHTRSHSLSFTVCYCLM